MSRIEKIVEGDWKFLQDVEDKGVQEEWFKIGLSTSRMVKVPHTWNVEPETVDYRGTAWYSYDFDIEEEWEKKRIRFRFEGIYRDASIWLNGVLIGKHEFAGFTTFTVDTNGNVSKDKKNTLILRVNNSPSREALPYDKSFDWADDGGVFRPVKMIITEDIAFDYIKIDGIPQITEIGKRVDKADALVNITAFISGVLQTPKNKDIFYKLELLKGIDNEKESIFKDTGKLIEQERGYSFQQVHLSEVSLWHFDSPQLYTAKLTLIVDEQERDTLEVKFGFREFKIEGSQFVLNGESVRICGTEWMPGSHPLYGNAESVEMIHKTLKQLKETNCIFTRFHWQQSDAVYEWCDKNGMLVQEEIPHWGKAAEFDEEKLMKISKQQYDEMIVSHYNHPSIIMWGIGNELYGQDETVKNFLTELKQYAKNQDIFRPINYVSNTIFKGAVSDATCLGDVIMVNEYIGTWHGDLDLTEELEKIRSYNPERAIVIAEYGLCEPAFSGGDQKRGKIFSEKMEVYSHIPEIAGTINFCLNDYRTQMGEDGKYQFRRRVHGSTDLFGEEKPSYKIIQERCAPVEIRIEAADGIVIYNRKDQEKQVSSGLRIHIKAKNTLPKYSISGYCLVLNHCEKIVEKINIPYMIPGDVWSMDIPTEIDQIIVLRGNGDVVIDKGI